MTSRFLPMLLADCDVVVMVGSALPAADDDHAAYSSCCLLTIHIRY
jgi:hypothetical protein